MTGTSDLEERVARAIQTTLGVSPLMAHTAARAAIEICGVENLITARAIAELTVDSELFEENERLIAALAKEKQATAELTVENELLGKQMDLIEGENDGLEEARAR